MEYKESERSGYQEREGKDFSEGVHIRQENSKGIMMYAVFDGEEQVSREFPPPQDRDCIMCAEVYSKAKEKYNE